MNLPILFQDQDLIAVNKPSGLLVHRSSLDKYETQFAVQRVAKQINHPVFPVHRLDRPTSGALVFALSSDVARELSTQFADRSVQKTYLAIVRGTPPLEVEINHPLKELPESDGDRAAFQNKLPQKAITRIERLATHEFQIQVDAYPTSQYSLVRARPLTGRRHQIRRHLRHINHPIIGDVRHGKGKHNRFFESQFQVRRLLLACTEMSFTHPRSGIAIRIQAPLAEDFQKILDQLGWTDSTASIAAN